MLHLVAWTFTPEKRNAIQARFKETGGLPPQGVKLLGRWSGIGSNKGMCVAQSNDPLALGTWAQQWSDLMSFDIYPVLTDEELAKTWQ
jgi:hypothetical protein